MLRRCLQPAARQHDAHWTALLRDQKCTCNQAAKGSISRKHIAEHKTIARAATAERHDVRYHAAQQLQTAVEGFKGVAQIANEEVRNAV